MESFVASVVVFLIIMVGYILLCVLVGLLASKLGRSSAGWFIVACFLSPILAAIILALLGEPEGYR